MSDNIGIVTGLYDAMARRDMAAIVAAVSPEVVIVQAEQLLWGGEHRGHDGLEAFFARLFENVQSRVTIDEAFEAGDRVIVIGRTAGHTVRGGVPFDVRVVHVWTLATGKVARFEPHIDTPRMNRALAGGASD